MTPSLSDKAADLRQLFDASFAAPMAPPSSAPLDFLAIRVGDDSVAIPLSDLAGLEAERKIVEVPADDPALLGIAGVQGHLVPVYSLAAVLGYADPAAPRWIALCDRDNPIGLAFTELEKYLRASPEDCFSTEVGPRREHVRGAIRVGQVVRYVLDLKSIVAVLRSHRSDGTQAER